MASEDAGTFGRESACSTSRSRADYGNMSSMAKETVVRLIDDLDGESIDSGGATVQFALEGQAYEIDLSEANVERLREAMQPFVKAGRKLGKAAGATGSVNPSATRRRDPERQAIRKWAQSNGYQIADRGRISEEVVVAYRNAH